MRRRTLIRGAVATALAPAAIVTAAGPAVAGGPAPARAATDLEGIDVSNYQAGIDYAGAAAEGRSFVIAKAGGASSPRGRTSRPPTPAMSTVPAPPVCA